MTTDDPEVRAERLRERLQRERTDLALLELQGEAGEGQVRVSLNGYYEVLGLRIDPELLKPERRAEVERLVSMAFNDAVAAAAAELPARLEDIAAETGR
jgi:DNA-binding protein YbaB